MKDQFLMIGWMPTLELTMHPWLTGRAQRIALLERLIQHIQQFDDVWCTTAEAVADYHKASSNSGSHVVNLG